jgi:hypothetical protein
LHAENHELSTGAADVLHVELSLAIRPRVRGEDCSVKGKFRELPY